MGRYHTITLTDAQDAACRAGYEQWVVDAGEHQSSRARAFRREGQTTWSTLVHALRVGGSTAHLSWPCWRSTAARPSGADAQFAGAGLFHTEPFAEHYIIDRTGNEFRLSGCVDLEECAIGDSLGEVVEMFASILALDQRYLAAFEEGYEEWFPFPSDALRRLWAGAVDLDFSNVLWLLGTMDKRAEWSFAISWLPAKSSVSKDGWTVRSGSTGLYSERTSAPGRRPITVHPYDFLRMKYPAAIPPAANTTRSSARPATSPPVKGEAASRFGAGRRGG